jgi:hypothetical protein
VGVPSVGSCVVYEFHGDQPDLNDPVQPAGLDAGPKMNITAATGTRTLAPDSKGVYSGKLANGAGCGGGPGCLPPYLFPGIYTIDNGAGGADIGPFSATLNVPQSVNWTSQPQLLGNIPRSQDLTITWSGGGPDSTVVIFGGTALPVNNPFVGEFLCSARAGDGQFTIPSYVLANVPATILPETTLQSFLSVGSASSARFNARGLDAGYAFSLASAVQVVVFQ